MREDFRREIKPRRQDYLAASLGLAKLPGMEVTEERIKAFCTPCDNLGADNICINAGERDQARYVDRLWCGWASVRGVRGSMTEDGFIGPKRPPSEPSI